MFRNQYDSDVTVWSPQGRLHQVEYAMEAVKLGSATVGLKSRQFAVLIALKRAVSELSAYQKKVIPIDEHIGISISGLTADARMLSRYMRTECLNYRYAHDAPMPVGRLIGQVGNKMQICTQRYDKRPLGVGLLVAGYDDQGPHIYQTCPSANFFDCRAMAIGARSQSARTYLEKHLSTFADCDLQELVAHGLRALRDTLPNEVDLNTKNVSIAVVGPKTPLRVSDEEELTRFLALVEGEERRGGSGTATGDAGAGAEPTGDDAPAALVNRGAMNRFILALIVTAVHALNLDYLDPTKLQTKTSPLVQKNAALLIITKYITQDNPSVEVEIDPQLFSDNKDVFSLKTSKGILYIRASSGVAAVWGYNYFLKKYCKSQIAWQVQRLSINKKLPEIDETVIASDRFRYYQNVCTVSYSFVWWKVQEWTDHVAWMALNGINMALAPVAQEAAWAKVYRLLGMTNNEINSHFTGPAFLSWLRMGNVHGWGGPLPDSWNEGQKLIQKKIVNLMFELGIVPVFPAFNGHVPRAFTRIFPNSTYYSVDKWNRFDDDYCCGLYLDPNDPLFNRISKMFLTEVTGGIETGHIYTADPFNEVKIQPWSTALVRDTALAIHASLSEFDRNSVWLLQSWMFVSDPILWPMARVKTFLTSVPNGRILVLDLQAEQWPQYNLYDMYYGQPFIWSMLHNFGGTLGMFGNVITINKDVYEARSINGSTMIGTGLTPEGINQNYVVYDLMLESAWRKTPVVIETWIEEYAERRYGCKSTSMVWSYLLKSVYSFNGLNMMRGKYVITRRPSFRIRPWAWYKSSDLFSALKYFVYLNDADCNSDGFFYDLVDVTRQALQYRAEQLYLKLLKDRNSSVGTFNATMALFLDAMNDMSLILAESDHFSATNWIQGAQSWATNLKDLYVYELNAKNQITLWGPNGEITDYACKQWAEMFRYYYIPRWTTFLKTFLDSKVSLSPWNEKDAQNYVRRIVEEKFVAQRIKKITPSLGVRDLAERFYEKWVSVNLEDLPLKVIKPEPGRRTTLADVDISREAVDDPTVVMWLTTPIV